MAMVDGKIAAASRRRALALQAVEGLAVAYQDAQRAARDRGRNADRNLPHEALAAIGTKRGLDHDIIARTRFGNIGAGRFQPREAALRHGMFRFSSTPVISGLW